MDFRILILVFAFVNLVNGELDLEQFISNNKSTLFGVIFGGVSLAGIILTLLLIIFRRKRKRFEDTSSDSTKSSDGIQVPMKKKLQVSQKKPSVWDKINVFSEGPNSSFGKAEETLIQKAIKKPKPYDFESSSIMSMKTTGFDVSDYQTNPMNSELSSDLRSDIRSDTTTEDSSEDLIENPSAWERKILKKKRQYSTFLNIVKF